MARTSWLSVICSVLPFHFPSPSATGRPGRQQRPLSAATKRASHAYSWLGARLRSRFDGEGEKPTPRSHALCQRPPGISTNSYTSREPPTSRKGQAFAADSAASMDSASITV